MTIEYIPLKRANCLKGQHAKLQISDNETAGLPVEKDRQSRSVMNGFFVDACKEEEAGHSFSVGFFIMQIN